MTDRTNSPSQDARGTAREPNPSPDQMVSLAYVVSGASQREDRKVAAEIERIFRCRQRDLSTEGGES